MTERREGGSVMSDSHDAEKPWLLLERGLYWRPNAWGYTGRRDKAGRYTTKDMLAYCESEGVSAIHEDAALPLAPNCSQEVALEYANEQIARLESEVERLKGTRDEIAALQDEREKWSDEALADRLRADRRLAERNAAIEAKDAAEAARTTAVSERDVLRAEVERLREALGLQPIKGAAYFRHIGILPEVK